MRADALANRRSLVRAARKLYAGRDGDFPFSAIAEEAGVGIATLYRHFPTQQDLAIGVAEHVREEMVAICDRWLPRLRTDGERAWTGFATDMAALELGTFMPRLVQDLGQGRLAPQLADVRTQALSAVRSVVDEAKRQDLVRDDVTPEHFQLGLGILSRPLPNAAAVPSDLGDWLVGVYLRGLRPGR